MSGCWARSWSAWPGGLLAGLILTLVGIDLGTSFFKDILIAFAGAVILLFLLRLVKGKK